VLSSSPSLMRIAYKFMKGESMELNYMIDV
jgi:hypothetical protein